ncbi:unnamed protein product [Urochloa decumbens]|uniref:ENTH domain-containing protein n=1 Tax=Urochloa decumbens TaxID=240449 RepID=A0ABC9B9D2_9POAL
MKVFKGKIWAAIGSLMDHAGTASSAKPSSAVAVPDRALLAAIESAVERCTTTTGADDDRHVHEILFLVSNAPGAITFLSRRITARLESARSAAAALRSLLLLHRLLRAGDRYFEQDLRALWSSRDLRLHAPVFSSAAASYVAAGAVATGACAFVHGYSAYLEERMLWVINQAGNLEPARRPPASAGGKPTSSSDESEALVLKLGMCQRLLELAMQLLPDNNTASGCAAARAAFGIVLRESFKVYAAFAEGLDAMMLLLRSSRLSKPVRVSAHEILKKACAQTPDLREFYHKCKGSSASNKSLEYPIVRVVTPAQAAAMEMSLPVPIPEEEEGAQEGEVKVEMAETSGDDGAGGGSTVFAARKMETTISEVWVEFEEDEKLIPGPGDGHSLKEPKAS